MIKHQIKCCVYYEDTDAGGVVYYANYLKYAERGRTELLRSIGFENSAMYDEKGILFVVRNLEADYHAPARLDDVLEIRTEVNHVKRASLIMGQSFFCQDRLLFSMTVTLACVDKTGKPVGLPKELTSELSRIDKGSRL